MLSLELLQLKYNDLVHMIKGAGAYLHMGSDEPVIQVVGLVKEEMAGSNVLWLT